MRRTVTLLCSVIVLLATTAAPAAAAPTPQVKITSDMFYTPPYNSGTFVASGPRLCEKGGVIDLGYSTAYADGDVQVIIVPKTFTCADGSGTFVVTLTVLQNVSQGSEVFLWNITGGTGRYCGLQGGGIGTTQMGDWPDGPVTNYYTGAVRG